MSLRVLWVTQDFPPDVGGIQTYSAELVRALVGQGVDVEVLAPKRPGDRDHDRRFPAPVVRLPVPRDAMPLAAAAHVALERRSFDVAMHAQWTTASGSLVALRRGRIGRVVVAAHGRELLWRPAALAAAHERWRRAVLRATDRVVAVSGYTRELALGLGVAPSRTAIVANGSDPRAFDRPEIRARAHELRASISGTRIVLTIARLVPHKGIDTILYALPKVVRELPDVAYVVVGDGRDRDRLRSLARELDVERHVRFVGSVDDRDALAWMHACDVFALASRAHAADVEGFGIVLLDAAACGRPVVAGRSGGIPDAVEHGETGLLCDPLAPDDFTNALLDVLDDPRHARALGDAGRRRVEHGFTWAHAGARLHAALAPAARNQAGDPAQDPHVIAPASL